MSGSLQIFRRTANRSIALANRDWTLQFQYDKASKGRCIAEFIPTAEFDIGNYKPIKLQKVFGCLGLIDLEGHLFLGVVAGCAQVAKVRDGETVQRIHAVEFYCLDSDQFDTKFVDVNGNPVDMDQADVFDSVERPPDQEHPCAEIQRLLSGGTFYFSSDHDLSMNLQARASREFDPEAFDHQFLWNNYLIGPLSQMRANMQASRRAALDESRFLTTIIRGFAETIAVSIGDSMPGQLTLISRLSSKRAGTRFNARGIDDDGNVANFVEIETILHTNAFTSSFCQVRGSIPLFWEQVSTGFMGQHKVEVSRSPSATQAAFERHFASLLEKYGEVVHVVNLLGSAAGETMLTDLYSTALSSSDYGTRVRYSHFDFHHEVRQGYEGASKVKPLLRASAEEYGFFLQANTAKLEMHQSGVFRTNCLDCLDRTNMIQNIISQANLESVLATLKIRALAGLWERHGTLWADNGDALSRIYAGTGALKTSFTRKGKMSFAGNFAGALADATKSVGRMYINNFQDKGKQQTIDVMLGRLIQQKAVVLFDPIADWVNTELHKRATEWSSMQSLKVFAGTYNLNGRDGDENLMPWLAPQGQIDADIYAIGFQEIVELTPSQIVSADPIKVRFWAEKVLACLDPKQRDRYVLLRTGQLVGAALLIFVRRECLEHIKHVEGAMRKTGLKGMSGNKGAVAVRMDYGATRICFLNAHFAAGHQNYHERNQDFVTILHGIKFQRGRNVLDHHDAVIWLGDFNYRISLPIEQVKALIEQEDWGQLYSADQLNREMIKGKVFQYFDEAEITFPPTYKFDNGTDEYDTSDKQRIPAWTDRILKKGSGMRQLQYGSAMLRLSDHKPVFATYQMDVQLVDEVKRSAIERGLYDQRRVAIDEHSSLRDEEIESIMGKDCKLPHLWCLTNASATSEYGAIKMVAGTPCLLQVSCAASDWHDPQSKKAC
jgi:hypothetical protein